MQFFIFQTTPSLPQAQQFYKFLQKLKEDHQSFQIYFEACKFNRQNVSLFQKNLIVISLMRSAIAIFSLCNVTYEYREECFEYLFDDICVPWNITKNCLVKKISLNEHQCAIYDCSVS